MTIDERIGALTIDLELLSHSTEAHDRQIAELRDSIAKLVEVSNRDAANIRILARIAEAHESRIADFEG